MLKIKFLNLLKTIKIYKIQNYCHFLLKLNLKVYFIEFNKIKCDF